MLTTNSFWRQQNFLKSIVEDQMDRNELVKVVSSIILGEKEAVVQD